MALSPVAEHARDISLRELAEDLAAKGEHLPSPDVVSFGQAFDRFGDAKVVLLGEASHGTSEFYRARATITKRLIERHGFTIVAVEADWPDAASIDRYIRHGPAVTAPEPPFARFPTWMWRNLEMVAFTSWLRGYNENRPRDLQVEFRGLMSTVCTDRLPPCSPISIGLTRRAQPRRANAMAVSRHGKTIPPAMDEPSSPAATLAKMWSSNSYATC